MHAELYDDCIVVPMARIHAPAQSAPPPLPPRARVRVRVVTPIEDLCEIIRDDDDLDRPRSDAGKALLTATIADVIAEHGPLQRRNARAAALIAEKVWHAAFVSARFRDRAPVDAQCIAFKFAEYATSAWMR
jgi:hypothetical protein